MGRRKKVIIGGISFIVFVLCIKFGLAFYVDHQEKQAVVNPETSPVTSPVKEENTKKSTHVGKEEDSNKYINKYGYDITVSQPSIVDSDEKNLKNFDITTVDNVKYIFKSFDLTSKNVPVSYYSTGEDETSAYYSLSTKKIVYPVNATVKKIFQRLGICRIYRMHKIGKWFGFDANSLYQFSESGTVESFVGSNEIASDLFISDVECVQDNTYIIALKNENSCKMIRYNMKTRTVEKEYTDCSNIWKVENNVIYASKMNGNLVVIHDDTGEVKEIPIQGVKLVEEGFGFQKDDNQSLLLDFDRLYKYDVKDGKIYLACRAGIYRWNEITNHWELIYDEMKNVCFMDMIHITCFHVVRDGEFYISVSNNDGDTNGGTGTLFYHLTENNVLEAVMK